jgi:hypothetical protein
MGWSAILEELDDCRLCRSCEKFSNAERRKSKNWLQPSTVGATRHSPG